jgi:hypothetical protein
MATLNSFLEKAGVCIGEAGGALHQFVPDGLVAHFGIPMHLAASPGSPSSPESSAVHAAVALSELANSINQQRAARKPLGAYDPLVVGVRCIHFSPADDQAEPNNSLILSGLVLGEALSHLSRRGSDRSSDRL